MYSNLAVEIAMAIAVTRAHMMCRVMSAAVREAAAQEVIATAALTHYSGMAAKNACTTEAMAAVCLYTIEAVAIVETSPHTAAE